MRRISFHSRCDGGIGFLGTGIAVIALAGGKVCQTGCETTIPGSPTARAGPDKNTTGGSPTTLDGSASSDPNGDPLTYQWNYISGPPAGQVAWITAANQAVVQVTCTGDGDYQFRLTVQNPFFGMSSDTAWLHVGQPGWQTIPPGVVQVD